MPTPDRARRLILLRPAKSSWNNAGPRDHDRPLAPRGRADAPRMATHLCRKRWSP